MNNKTKRLVVFLTISLLWSLLWFTNKESIFRIVKTIPSLQFYFLAIIPVIGILIGSLISRRQQPNNEMSFTGKSAFHSWLIVIVPIACLSIIGVPNNIGLQPNLFALIIGIFTMIYAFIEELGWRGYLQEELTDKYDKWIVYIIVGLVWYLWHWYFLREGSTPKLIMIPILIIASFGIGEIAKSTKSILICGALHGLANLLLIYGVVAQNISNQNKLVILIVSLAIWIPIIKQIEKKNTTTNRVVRNND